jgi:hypothetical protein
MYFLQKVILFILPEDKIHSSFLNHIPFIETEKCIEYWKVSEVFISESIPSLPLFQLLSDVSHLFIDT